MSELVRPWNIGDAAGVFDASVVPDLVRQIHLPVPGIEGAMAWVMRRHDFDPVKLRSFAIECDDELAGEVALHSFSEEHAVATVGYWLVPEARGRGLATRATWTLIAWAFDELGVERIQLDHRVNNPESGGVARRCGFTAEGVQRARLRYDGERFDVATYGLLATDARPAIKPLELHHAR